MILMKNSENQKAGTGRGSIDKKIWEYTAEQNSISRERLDAAAIIDCTRKYTYAQMFKEWERYAGVFSGLSICESSRSRVAIAGAITAEPVFCFYGLNMTGAEVSMFSYPDFLPGGNWKTMIEKEKITDLIISDIMVTPSLWEEIQKEKEHLGLKHVILLHSKMGGPCTGPAELLYNEFNYHALKRLPGALFMEDLTDEFEDFPITYGKYDKQNIGVIAHTSGTANGIRKPIVFGEKDFNDLASLYIGSSDTVKLDYSKEPDGNQVYMLILFDLSSLQMLMGGVNAILAGGNVGVFTFFGFLHPKFIKAVPYYGITLLGMSGFMIDKWMEDKAVKDLDLSGLTNIRLTGSYVSPSRLKEYKAFLKAHGFNGELTRGYGMSEVNGNGFAAQSEEDELGQPFYRNLIRVRDENDNKYYTLDDGPRTGILYMSGLSVCRNELDGEKLFDYEVIDGNNYICTNDMIRIEKDGKIVYAGRADKYFANNEGRRFDSGIVETTMTKHPYIAGCAVVPVFEKRIHDTVPVLYVIPGKKGRNAAENIRKALFDYYVKERKLGKDDLPVQFMIVKDIPCNQNGKIDIFKITRQRLSGDAYNIIPVIKNGKLSDLNIEHVDRLSSIVANVPEGMENGSAFNIYDIFN